MSQVTELYYSVILKINGDQVKLKRAFKNEIYACTYAARHSVLESCEAYVIDSEGSVIFNCSYIKSSI